MTAPTKEGYTFTGWTGSNGDAPQKDVTIKKGTAKNLSFKANWEINYYTLDLNSEVDGECLTHLPDGCTCDLYINGQLEAAGINDIFKQYPYGTTYEFKNFRTGVNLVYANKVQSVYHDSEGNLDKNCQSLKGTVKAYLNSSKYGGMTHVVPIFNIKSVNVTFHRNTSSSDTQTASQTFTYGVAGQSFSDKGWSYAGHTLLGWAYSNNATEAYHTPLNGVLDSWINTEYPKVDLYAVWSANRYTVTYDANGGTGTMSTDTATYDENYVTKANQFTRTGYEFVGWTTNADGSGSNWTSWIGKPWKWTYTKNITLYAQWKAKTYTITYEPNGGVGDRYTQTATYDAYFKTMKNRFTRTGYTFAGFIDLNGRVGTYAKINKKSFLENNALKHPWNLSKVDSEYQFYNYTDKVWETYCLIYWEGPYNVDYGCSPSNFTLSAKWWANNYTVKLDYKKDVGSSYEKTIVTTYDKAYGELPQPVLQGWTFKGWNTKSDGTGTTVTADTVYKIAGDSTLYAQWQINTYDLSVKHTVSGNMGNKCSDFSFTLNLSGMSGNNITAVFTDASGKQTTKILAMNNGKVAFTLKHGETVVFKNVPYNTSYTITEDNVRDYIVSSSNASGKVTDNTAATFTSVRNMMVPTSADTNIIAMISIICVAGVAILLILKRRKTK